MQSRSNRFCFSSYTVIQYIPIKTHFFTSFDSFNDEFAVPITTI